MVMKSSNRWPALILGAAVMVASASAYHEGTYTYSSDSYFTQTCIEDYKNDGYCDNRNNNAECEYDGGDCCECTCTYEGSDDFDYLCGPNSNYACVDPSAACVDDDDITMEMVEHCAFPTGIGNGWCDQGNNNEICGYDGGDCCECTCEQVPDSWSESEYYGCEEEYFQCIDPSAACVDDDDVTAEMVENCGYIWSIGDGYCNAENNKPECGYDGGDCCECTCSRDDDDDWACSEKGAGFACIDPEAECVNDDDITVGIAENCPHPETIGDGYCNIGNNKEECGYDGGDCCECTCDLEKNLEHHDDDYAHNWLCNEFACIDPSAECVDDDDVTVDMIGSCGYVLGVGNGYCDMNNNNAECAYDGGDCCECTCNPQDNPWGDDDSWNSCTDGGSACIDPAAPCVDDDSFTEDMIENCGWPQGLGDGYCDQNNNKAECNYDGGDCCECTCEEKNSWSCREFSCIDPAAACVNDDDITVDMIENCGYVNGVGNGYCDRENNTEECNFDGGDCCSCDCVIPEHYENYDDDYDWLCSPNGSGFDCKDPASQCFGEVVEPGYDDDYDNDDVSEFTPWVQEGPLPTMENAIEVGMLTEVGVTATSHDPRAGRSDRNVGCGEAGGAGCAPEK